jgi:antirestriction protein ArdC
MEKETEMTTMRKSFVRTSRSQADRRDHYQEVTDKIVAALEAGRKPWQRPWDPARAGLGTAPVNAATGHRYRGINSLVLGLSPLSFETSEPRWCSYKQAKERGWQVRHGETGTTIFFFKKLAIGGHDANVGEKSRADAGDQTKFIPLLRAFTVFHASQIDGIPEFRTPDSSKLLIQRIEAADLIMKNSGADIRIGGDRAYYCPSTDHIQLPPDGAFRSSEGHAATALHEMSHWTGASHRLNRDLTGSFGTQAYSREELRAEISSALIGTILGLPTDLENHASYIGSWIGILKEDKREIFRAAADAQKIADYLLNFHPDYATVGGDGNEAPERPARTGSLDQAA